VQLPGKAPLRARTRTRDLCTDAALSCGVQGAPFMEGLQANVPLCRAIAITYGVCIVAVLEMSPDITELLQLVPFPTEMVCVCVCARARVRVFVDGCVRASDTCALFRLADD
jgi:hypothetical protein